MNDDMKPRQLSIKALLSDRVEYVIPMYQRNYAWKEGEITSLIQDVIDSMPADENIEGKNYYVGTLVVYERNDGKQIKYETIDGQQRLTTLSLLASYLKNEHDKEIDLTWYDELKIHFESRENSQRTFASIFKGNDPSVVLAEKEINTAIHDGYKLVAKILPLKIKEGKTSLKKFADYLFNQVQVMRVKVPDDTDLNHYFEIMNSRGEQLEKHEILKSMMMEVLNNIKDPTDREESQNCLHLVWEACANMESYSQMGFGVEQRNAIYGEKDWGKFKALDFDWLRTVLRPMAGSASQSLVEKTLEEVIAQARAGIEGDEKPEESPARFNTVISFSNFLLHVLLVVSQDKDVKLDDKRLISMFESHVLKPDDAIDRVKAFTFALIRCKYLFDQFIIKRDFSKGADGEWSLKRLKWYEGDRKSKSGRGSYVNTFGDEDGQDGINRRILMLLSALHVSTPTMVYKHWLNAALYYLFHAEGVEPESYVQYLESVTKAFVFDRFMASGGGGEYHDMIYLKKGVCQSRKWEGLEESRLRFGNIENIVFNYLDYLLWLKHKDGDTKVGNYEFTFRSSVEHYYPQNPMPESGLQKMAEGSLNSFGNLCLISHSKNSRLSNFSPKAKTDYYKSGAIDSVKQHLMTQIVEKTGSWDEASIAGHYADMKAVLVSNLEGN